MASAGSTTNVFVALEIERSAKSRLRASEMPARDSVNNGSKVLRVCIQAPLLCQS